MSPSAPGPGMALSPWLTLRQAREALAAGRPADAHRLLDPLLADGHRKAWKLARDVARGYVARGEWFLRHDNPDDAWGELHSAESLNTGEQPVAALRKTLTRLGLATARAALEAGNPQAAVDVAARLRERGVRDPQLDPLSDAAADWVLAGEQADRGDFLLALAALDRIRPRLPCPPTGLDRFTAALDARHDRLRKALANLHESADEARWREAVGWADEALAAAPQHREARSVRAHAWAVVNPDTAAYAPAARSVVASPAAFSLASAASAGGPVFAPLHSPPPAASPAPPPSRSPTLTAAPGLPPDVSSAGGATLPKRFLLWVDGVGGYLVCLSARVSFGQATGAGPVDVPLFADVSRLHAELARDAEGYVLDSVKGVRVNGGEVSRAVLKPGDRVTLGATCQVQFHQPVPVSPSARLELVSGHRLPLPVDGVLLMADSLLMGPGPEAHVVVPGLDAAVVLYRSKDGLGVRWPGAFRVDNRPCENRSAVPLPAVVSGDTLTFALEPVGSRL